MCPLIVVARVALAALVLLLNLNVLVVLRVSVLQHWLGSGGQLALDVNLVVSLVRIACCKALQRNASKQRLP